VDLDLLCICIRDFKKGNLVLYDDLLQLSAFPAL